MLPYTPSSDLLFDNGIVRSYFCLIVCHSSVVISCICYVFWNRNSDRMEKKRCMPSHARKTASIQPRTSPPNFQASFSSGNCFISLSRQGFRFRMMRGTCIWLARAVVRFLFCLLRLESIRAFLLLFRMLNIIIVHIRCRKYSCRATFMFNEWKGVQHSKQWTINANRRIREQD